MDIEVGSQTQKYILLKHQTMLKGALSEHRAFHSSLIHTKLLVELVKLVESRLPGEEGALHE